MPDVRGLVSDPEFKALDPERQSALLKRTGASGEFINEYIESGVVKADPVEAGINEANELAMDPNLPPMGATMLPEDAAGVAGAAGTMGAMAAGGAGLGALGVGVKTAGGIVGGLEGLRRGPGGAALGVLAGAALPGMGGRLMRSVMARRLVSKLMGGTFAPAPAAGQLTQAEAQLIVRNMAKAEPGAVLNPPPAAVAELMQPKLPPGVDASTVEGLIQKGFPRELAIKLASKAAPAASVAPTAATVAPTATVTQPLAARQAALLAESGGGNPFASTPAPGRPTATELGYSGATIEEILKALKKGKKVQDLLRVAGEGVTTP